MLGWYTAERNLHLQGRCVVWFEGDMLLSEGDLLSYSVCAEARDEDQPSA